MLLCLPGTVTRLFLEANVVKLLKHKHLLRWGVGYSNYFVQTQSEVKLKSRKRWSGDFFLANSTVMETTPNQVDHATEGTNIAMRQGLDQLQFAIPEPSASYGSLICCFTVCGNCFRSDCN